MSTRAYTGMAVVFAAGIFLGAVASQFVRCPPFGRPPGGPPGPPSSEMLLHRLSRDLNLDDIQVAKIRPAVQELHTGLEALRMETEPKVQAIIRNAVRNTEPFLNESQKTELHELASRFMHPPGEHSGARGPRREGERR